MSQVLFVIYIPIWAAENCTKVVHGLINVFFVFYILLLELVINKPVCTQDVMPSIMQFFQSNLINGFKLEI